MSASEKGDLSPDQKRYKVLTIECGLDHEQALHALGRRKAGYPLYQKLSRQEQLNKVRDLVSQGLTLNEASRLVGVPASHLEGSSLHDPSVSIVAPKSRSDAPSPRGTKLQSSPAFCYKCKKTCSDLALVPGKVWLCPECRKWLRKERKALKRRQDLANYQEALTRPDLSGLKGVRK